ncbi:hypothetical protein INT47_003464 [Mucor saturninus]|uniref:Uncharacterized protein n=1 Tax=Mucor saturninus TaxID=64648 RepID=A0A8H7RI25_9FUNG|nr:hypothetical protein INT47_003464 [Mucor saturninus]
MFQTKEYINKKHGKNGTDRAYYLNQLATEYKTTKNQEAKQQVLANLANFAYDPINYDSLWDLQVVSLLLGKFYIIGCELVLMSYYVTIIDPDPLLQEFGMAGSANICLNNKVLSK